jgi:hypothetical protein
MSHLREVDIPDQRTVACQHTVEVLEDMLERARAGELHGVLCIGEMADHGAVYVRWSQALDLRERLGSLEMIKFDWLKEMIPTTEEE